MNWYLAVLKKYAVFSGRARRKEFWIFVLLNAVIQVLLTLIDFLIGTFSLEAGVGLLSTVYSLAVMIPSIAVGVRRLHDTDRSGWWTLLPIVNFIFWVQDSQQGDNRFGPNPKAATT